MITMTRTVTDEEAARLILKYMREADTDKGQIMMAGALNYKFLKEGQTAADYNAGMKFATDIGWISDENTMVRLTEAGYRVAHSLK
jgi:hypothetical protein